ncbi:MAG TPA: rhombosortase [Burkholderiaceae bacterium]|nr:rhombosortase [Burkholderiaceae bacterium]HQR69435.1 rhombosortase [Burkholderiaceae bacterium]
MPMRVLSLSNAERCALVATAIALLLMAVGAGDALEYRRALLGDQPWRLITGHIVHISWPHALINTLALLIVARLFAPDLSAGRQLTVLGVAALVISLALATAYPGIDWYRGLSGVVHALFFAGATTWLVRSEPRSLRALWLPLTLVAGGWIKVALEQPAGTTLPHADWLGAAVVPQAHLVGAACGSVLGLAYALADRRRDKQRREQQQLQPR